MQEVLIKLNEAMSLLETKLADVTKKEELLKNAKVTLEAMQAKQVAAENNLKAKERVSASYDNLDKALELANSNNEKLNDEKTIVENKKKELEDKIAKVAKDEKEVADIKELFLRKNASLDEQLAKTKEVQAQLKAKLASLGIV